MGTVFRKTATKPLPATAEVFTRKGEQFSPAVVALNPNAKVPVIVDDGVVVFDSNAILLYLAEKHGKFLPGTHIPIFPPEKLWEARPDYVLILPWNLKTEIMHQLDGIREWGGQFVVPIPEVTVYP